MQKTILVVDDSATDLTVVEQVLGELYRVVALPSATQMFKVLEDITPDLILLDIELPDMDGFQAMSRLKEEGFDMEIPVIFLTSHSDSDHEAYGIELGAADFVAKPFSEPVLLNRIRNRVNTDALVLELRERIKSLEESLSQYQEG
jgi:putative two-component system response regulator